MLIDFLGLGSMGLGMATNLQRHLSQQGAVSLQYRNRTMSRGEPLKELGGVPAEDMAALANSSDIIFMSLSDDAALSSTLDDLIQSAQSLQGKTIVDTSTVHPMSSTKAQERLSEKGAAFIAAPVFGASPVAAKGQLLWIVAGPDSAVEKINPFIVGVMGRGVIRLGEDVKQSSMMKTAGLAVEPPSQNTG